MSRVLPALSMVILLLFAAIWTIMAIELIQFQPTPQTPTVDFADAVVTVAGFLASAVGAATAAVLGIEIQRVDKRKEFSGSRLSSLTGRVTEAAMTSWILMAGILLYAAVGVLILLVWIFNSEKSPDMIGAFALGVLGWLAGAFAAVFRKPTE